MLNMESCLIGAAFLFAKNPLFTRSVLQGSLKPHGYYSRLKLQ